MSLEAEEGGAPSANGLWQCVGFRSERQEMLAAQCNSQSAQGHREGDQEE